MWAEEDEHCQQRMKVGFGSFFVFFFFFFFRSFFLSHYSPQMQKNVTEVNVNNQTINVELNFSDYSREQLKLELTTAAELLTKIEAKLASSFQREIYKQDIPALLFPHPSAVLDKKHNIDVYLAFGFRTTQDPVKRARLVAFQIVSDYCLGLEVSELQKDKIYNGFLFEVVASDIVELLKTYNVSNTYLNNLRTLVTPLL
jgi:hypothetical protein